ncbi:hypothetical protein T4B_232 [Trichinella pseudospiralis]|uniref:Uncharacterized protein n=1 Tax=Trichinella pseudospiralis TaxID=6337 RepID=A0A0V1HBG5_TRIPS|nr:hypothetical protein T4B_232 [Trichinella pseudospiralis]
MVRAKEVCSDVWGLVIGQKDAAKGAPVEWTDAASSTINYFIRHRRRSRLGCRGQTGRARVSWLLEAPLRGGEVSPNCPRASLWAGRELCVCRPIISSKPGWKLWSGALRSTVEEAWCPIAFYGTSDPRQRSEKVEAKAESVCLDRRKCHRLHLHVTVVASWTTERLAPPTTTTDVDSVSGLDTGKECANPASYRHGS